MKRINIVGCSGSGKSTFGKALAEIINAPFIEMDDIFWLPNWEMPDNDTFFAALREAIAGETWVLDGNYSRSLAIKWERADTVIWLDYSFWRTFRQILRRSLGRAWRGHEIWEGSGNRETFAKLFLSRDSILLWMLTTHGKTRRKYQKLFAQNEYDHIQFIRLTSPKEAQQFMDRLKAVR